MNTELIKDLENEINEFNMSSPNLCTLIIVHPNTIFEIFNLTMINHITKEEMEKYTNLKYHGINIFRSKDVNEGQFIIK